MAAGSSKQAGAAAAAGARPSAVHTPPPHYPSCQSLTHSTSNPTFRCVFALFSAGALKKAKAATVLRGGGGEGWFGGGRRKRAGGGGVKGEEGEG